MASVMAFLPIALAKSRTLLELAINAGRSPRVSGSALKPIDMAIHEASKKWTEPIQDGKAAVNHFAIMFEDRIPKKTS